MRCPVAPPPELERTAAARERVRARKLAKTARWYSPWGHLVATTSIGLAVLVLAARNLHAVRPAELLVVPVTMALANLLEWRAHKYLLHRRTWPLELLYDRHTPEHHAIYMTDDMAIRSTSEFRLVLIPAVGVAAIVVATAPFAIFFGKVWCANAGWLFLVTASLMLVSYEVLHLSYHLPPESFVGRLSLVQVLRRHHARHHDPRLMQKWNFNVTVPFFDWVFGTIYKGEIAPTSMADKGAASSRICRPAP
jgi:hypothetical protein